MLTDTVKCEADLPEAVLGLPVREVANRIEKAGLRNKKVASTIEGSVAGGLARDSLFAYIGPGVFALHVRSAGMLCMSWRRAVR